jgi:thioredoxin 1
MSESETLETLRPNPAFAPAAYEDTMATWERVADDVVVKVWGGDWCVDCRQQLPDFGAVLDAAGVDAVEHYPVEREDGEKVGPGMREYDVEYIPTVVVEAAESGEELARFVESAPRPIAVELAEQLEDAFES